MATYRVETENGTFDVEVEEPQKPTLADHSLNDLKNIAVGAGKEYGKAFFEPIVEFGRGAAQTASFGTVGEDPALEGSVMQDPVQKYARMAGRGVGMVAPLLAAEATGGAGLAMATARRGGGALAQGVARGVGAGLAYGGAEEVATKGIPGVLEEPVVSAGRVAKAGAVFGAVGAAEVPLGMFASKVRKMVGEKFPAFVFDKIIDAKKAENVAEFEKVGETYGAKMSRRPGFYGSKETLLKEADSGIESLKKKIQGKLDAVNKEEMESGYATIDPKNVVGDLNKEIARYNRIPGGNTEARALEQVKADFLGRSKKQMTVSQANELKRDIYKTLNNRDFQKAVEQNPAKKQGRRLIASGLRQAIEDSVPDVRALNREQGVLIGVRNALSEGVGGSAKSFTDKFIAEPVLEPALTGGARILNRTLGTPSRFVTPVARQLPRKYISEPLLE